MFIGWLGSMLSSCGHWGIGSSWVDPDLSLNLAHVPFVCRFMMWLICIFTLAVDNININGITDTLSHDLRKKVYVLAGRNIRSFGFKV